MIKKHPELKTILKACDKLKDDCTTSEMEEVVKELRVLSKRLRIKKKDVTRLYFATQDIIGL